MGESAGNREASGSVTHLLGHPEEEVAVSALLLPCPHEARLHTCRSGAELHGALACAAAAAAAAGSGRGLTCPLWLLLSLSRHHAAFHIQLCLPGLPEKRGEESV